MALLMFLWDRNDVPEFSDEAVNASIMAFEGDLRVGLHSLFHQLFAYC